MQKNFYETLVMDPKFPIIFHYDYLEQLRNWMVPHWHEDIEILLITEGTVKVLSDTASATAAEGDIVVFHSNHIHYVQPETNATRYYCLIVSKAFCKSLNLDIDSREPNLVYKSGPHRSVYNQIVAEFNQKDDFYAPRMMGYVLVLLSGLFREAKSAGNTENDRKKSSKDRIIRPAMEYIALNYNQKLSVERLADQLGFSKYYFCHVFKEVTKKTVVDYINYIRCMNARRLLITTDCDVKTVAAQCGFENASYFTKKYKQIVGCLPSDTMQAKSIRKFYHK